MRQAIKIMIDEHIIRRQIITPIEEKVKVNRQKERENFVLALGGKCIKCGFTDWRALQVDHVDGAGTKDHKKYGGSSRRWYREVLASINRNENKYQLLCANCNWIKRYEFNEVRSFTSDPLNLSPANF